GEDDVRLASASGCESLLAEFADSIVEPPLRHPAPQANRISNSNHGSVACGIPLTLYFSREKSGASGLGEYKAKCGRIGRYGTAARSRRTTGRPQRGRDQTVSSSNRALES